MLLANPIAGFLNQLYLWKKFIKKPDFLHVDTNSWKVTVNWEMLRWMQSKMGVYCSDLRTLKLTVSQEPVNGMIWFLVFWCEFRKVKSFLKIFWLAVVKNGHGLLDLWTQKSAVALYLFNELIKWVLIFSMLMQI